MIVRSSAADSRVGRVHLVGTVYHVCPSREHGRTDRGGGRAGQSGQDNRHGGGSIVDDRHDQTQERSAPHTVEQGQHQPLAVPVHEPALRNCTNRGTDHQSTDQRAAVRVGAGPVLDQQNNGDRHDRGRELCKLRGHAEPHRPASRQDATVSGEHPAMVARTSRALRSAGALVENLGHVVRRSGGRTRPLIGVRVHPDSGMRGRSRGPAQPFGRACLHAWSQPSGGVHGTHEPLPHRSQVRRRPTSSALFGSQ
jgi:hypothetical protein